MSQRALHGAAAALGLLACLGAAAAAEPLALRIRNDTPAPLRCVLLPACLTARSSAATTWRAPWRSKGSIA